MATALTLYGQNTASTTLATANILQTATGSGTISKNTQVSTSSNYGEIYSQGNAGAWAAAGGTSGPSGHGFLYDTTALEGQQFVAGNWQPIVRMQMSAGSIVADIHVRLYKYNSVSLAYAQIGSDIVLASKSITTSNTICTLPATSEVAVNFNAGDKLYCDTWLNITTPDGTSGANVQFFMASVAGLGVANNMQITTPGYIAQPSTQTILRMRHRGIAHIQ